VEMFEERFDYCYFLVPYFVYLLVSTHKLLLFFEFRHMISTNFGLEAVYTMDAYDYSVCFG
jgi:hypothetical protein